MLLAADKVVGVMAIQSYEHERLYSRQDLALFSTIGSQVAAAIEKEVNARVLDGAAISCCNMPLADARAAGAAFVVVRDVEKDLSV